MKHITIVSFSLFALLGTQTALGATDYLLKLDGVEGETKMTTTESGTSIVADRAEQPVACTMEAKMCPDGSYVGRTGPTCEFTPCPVATTKVSSPTSGDPDFDLLKVSPMPPSSPPVRGTRDPDFDLLKTTPTP